MPATPASAAPPRDTTEQAQPRRTVWLVKKEGGAIRARIPESYTVGQAKAVLGDRAGYEPQLYGGELGMSLRLAVQTDEQGGLRLLPDGMRFGELEEDARIHPIPSLVPAASHQC